VGCPGWRRSEEDVLLDDVAAVVRVDEDVAAIAAEVGDHLRGARSEQRAAVVLEAAADEDVPAGVDVRPIPVVAGDQADIDRVVLQRIDRAVIEADPIGRIAVLVDLAVERTPVQAAVVAEVHVLGAVVRAQRDRMLVRMGALRTTIR
jgi:hypothetical protein